MSTLRLKHNLISDQGGCKVYRLTEDQVVKSGTRVRPSELEAMNLVCSSTLLALPEPIFAKFEEVKEGVGSIWMTFVDGARLDTVWKGLNPTSKAQVCREIWDYITTIRQIPRSRNSIRALQCSADGSVSEDLLLRDDSIPPRQIQSDDDLRQRIYERYRARGGDKYADSLLDLLPNSSQYVFTHGDVAPRNIMVDDQFQIKGILDWENSGWYPHYWEYANIMRPSSEFDDWQTFMDRTAPKSLKCDLKGIRAARVVIF